MRVKVGTYLETSAENAWQAAKKSATFVEVTRGIMGVDGEFPEEVTEGDTYELKLRFFHVLPGNLHTIKVARVDDEKREIFTNETGGMVRSWDHLIRIRPSTETRCTYTDRIDIEAGLLTPLVWLYAQGFYRYRQMRWRRFARSLNA